MFTPQRSASSFEARKQASSQLTLDPSQPLATPTPGSLHFFELLEEILTVINNKLEELFVL